MQESSGTTEVKPLPNMDEKKHKIIDWLRSSHGLAPVKNTMSLLKVSDIETEALPFPFPANPYRS